MRDDASATRAFMVGLAGLSLSGAEVAFLDRWRPCGIILFTRNYESEVQLQALVEAARTAAGGGDLLVLVDQEGGRVQRLRGEFWPDVPPAAVFGQLYSNAPTEAVAAVRDVSALVGARLKHVGINTNCIPCLDLAVDGAHDIIGSRAFGRSPEVVTALGRAVADGLADAGVLAVMKHLPGHGRAYADSHLELPKIDAAREELSQTDWVPMRNLADLQAGMTAHVLYPALDAERCASISPTVIDQVVRDDIGFDGLLMSDDLSMKALSGGIRDRGAQVLSAGCDVALHCNGDMAEMLELAPAMPFLAGRARQRWEACLQVTRKQAEIDEAAGLSALARMQAYARNTMQSARP